MEKFVSLKTVTILLVVCTFLLFISTCNSCSSKNNSSKSNKEIDKLNYKIDSLYGMIYTKEELDIRTEIINLEASKEILYQWNAVVRTKERPDDATNEYEKRIKELKKKLNQIKK
jgi:pyruvate/2-oxoacid:ferredoxin oxidoreductase beta subunit